MSGHWLRHTVDTNVRCMYVVVIDYCRTYVKAVRGGGGEEGGHVLCDSLWDATSRSLWTSRTTTH